MLRKTVILIALFIVPMVGFSQVTNPADLDQYRWENRLLLLFTPTQTNGNYQQQLEELENEKAGIYARDLKVFHLIDNGKAFVDDRDIRKASVERLIHTYHVDPGSFTIILIGLDGSEKLRETNPVTAEKLFEVIDAMPMRQREMNQQNNNTAIL